MLEIGPVVYIDQRFVRKDFSIHGGQAISGLIDCVFSIGLPGALNWVLTLVWAKNIGNLGMA